MRLLVGVASAAMGIGAAFAEANLLENPGLEDGATGWKRVNPPVWRVVDGEGYGGSKALVWENDDPKRYVYPVRELKIEPGGVYHFTALVKVDRLNKEGRVQVGIEWNNRDGKWGGGSYARVVDDNGMLRDGWVRYEATTAPMPADVGGKAGMLAVMTKGSVGRVRFDDFTFEARDVRTVDYLVSSAYRDRAAEGKVRFVSALHLNTVRHPLSDYAVELAYKAADGKSAVARPTTLSPDLAVFEFDVAALAKGSQVVTLEARCVPEGKVLGRESLRFTRLGHPLRRRVTFDAAHRMLLDGRRFYPLGMYTSGMDDATVRRYAEGPFNFACQYGRCTPKNLDDYAKIGVFAATDVRSMIYGYDYSAKSRFKTLDESKEAFRAKYAEIGDHPALVMWYVNDEAPLSFVKNVSDVVAFLREIDPERAILACLCHPETARNFLPSYDFLALDTYPVGWKTGRNRMESVWERQRTIEASMLAMRPHWYIPQAFNWKWFMSDEAVRMNGITDQHFPTRGEMANMTWQGVAGGANGVLMYSFEAMRRSLTNETEFAAAWSDVLSVAREVKRFESVLLSDDLAVASELPKEIVARAWRQDGRDWYLVVNRFRQNVRGTLRLPAKAGTFRIEAGSDVSLSADGTALACSFAPLGYAFVSLSGNSH